VSSKSLVTASKPLTFKINVQVPSLKNDKMLVVNPTTNKPIVKKSEKVERFLKGVRGGLMKQFNELPTQLQVEMPFEGKMGYWFDFYFFSHQEMAPNDTDNAQTTAQELAQSLTQPSGVLGIVKDDKQFVSIHAEKFSVPNRLLAGAVLFFWQYQDTRQDLNALLDYREHYYEASRTVAAVPSFLEDLL
jgi:hypothetical protein